MHSYWEKNVDFPSKIELIQNKCMRTKEYLFLHYLIDEGSKLD